MKVRILRVPPSHTLEGIDLRPYRLKRGRVHDVDSQLATVLVLWEYAEPVAEDVPPPDARPRARVARESTP